MEFRCWSTAQQFSKANKQSARRINLKKYILWSALNIYYFWLEAEAIKIQRQCSKLYIVCLTSAPQPTKPTDQIDVYRWKIFHFPPRFSFSIGGIGVLRGEVLCKERISDNICEPRNCSKPSECFINPSDKLYQRQTENSESRSLPLPSSPSEPS